MPRSRSRSDPALASVRARVDVVGSIYLDVLCTPHGPARRSLGGVGRNLAVHLGRAGVDVALIALCSGREQALRGSLGRAGVRADLREVVGGTGLFRASYDRLGGLTVDEVVHPPLDPLDASFVAEHCRDDARFLVVESSLPGPTIDAIVADTRAHHKSLCVMPTRLPEFGLDDRLLEAADLLIVNRAEAALLAGEELTSMGTARAWALATAKRVPTVLLTLGADGVGLARAGRWTHRAAPPVDVVHPVGAGDALAAGFLAGIVHGLSQAAALDRGLRLAGRVLGEPAAVPTLDPPQLSRSTRHQQEAT